MKRYLIILLLLTFSIPGFAAKKQKPPYDYFRIGSTIDVSHLTQPGTVLMGGGTDVDVYVEQQRRFSGNPRNRHRCL